MHPKGNPFPFRTKTSFWWRDPACSAGREPFQRQGLALGRLETSSGWLFLGVLLTFDRVGSRLLSPDLCGLVPVRGHHLLLRDSPSSAV